MKALKSMNHILKIEKAFADAICDGRKRFEIRRNDRGYNAGDTVEFRCVEQGQDVRHRINSRKYRINYCLNGYGLREAFIVFGIEEVSSNDR